MILAGTTAYKMRGVYSRPHRNSIYEPATIHDLPFEVLRESFKLQSKSRVSIYDLPFEVLEESFTYLTKQFGNDLASPSSVCRAFRAVALELMNSRKRFAKDKDKIEPFICGLAIRLIVGLEMCTIKHLILGLKSVGKEYIHSITRAVSTTLTSLYIIWKGIDSTGCYEVLRVIFEQCGGIRNLRLAWFDFGGDPSTLSQIMMDKFSRLIKLELFKCRGDIRMFVETTSIPSLKLLNYRSDREASEKEEIISMFASKGRSLVGVVLLAKFDSSASLLNLSQSVSFVVPIFSILILLL
jgi:hypothetical protein